MPPVHRTTCTVTKKLQVASVGAKALKRGKECEAAGRSGVGLALMNGRKMCRTQLISSATQLHLLDQFNEFWTKRYKDIMYQFVVGYCLFVQYLKTAQRSLCSRLIRPATLQVSWPWPSERFMQLRLPLQVLLLLLDTLLVLVPQIRLPITEGNCLLGNSLYPLNLSSGPLPSHDPAHSCSPCCYRSDLYRRRPQEVQGFFLHLQANFLSCPVQFFVHIFLSFKSVFIIDWYPYTCNEMYT